MSFVGVRTLWARAALLALSAPLLMAGAIPASAATIGHAMTATVESESQVDFFADSEADATIIRLPGCLKLIPLGCFRPETIRAAYGVQSVLGQGITGKGRTIVIIGAFREPALVSDVQMFDRAWSPDPSQPSPNPFVPQVIPMFGVPAFDPNPKGVQFPFSLEQAIDVEWAHVIAPDASIVVVEAKSAQDADLVAATQYAVDNNLGDIITQSFGEAEMCAPADVLALQHAVFQKATELGITVFASSGDKGAARQSCDGTSFVFSVSTPASDPLVTAVGGTHLVAGAGGVYQSESAWSGSGGGFSNLYGRPTYQAPLQKDNNKARGVPDVAFNADKTSGYVVWWMGMGAVVGGTSAGSPQWAGVVALANQAAGHRLGSINKTLYHIRRSQATSAAFNDITVGNNNFMSFKGFDAESGWDAVTGLGTPNVANLIPLLVSGEG